MDCRDANHESSIEFREATLRDLPDIVALVEAAYRGETSRKGWTTEADLLDGQRTDADEVASIIDDPLSCIVVAQSNDVLLGSVMLRDEDHSAYVGMLAIRPDCQAQGLGRRLLERVEQIARERLAAARTRMTVIAQREELIQWYERRGYRRTGENEPFPYGNPRFGLPKRPDLSFVVLEKSLAR